MAKKKHLLLGTVDVGWRIKQFQRFAKDHLSDRLESSSLVYYHVPSSVHRTAYDRPYNIHHRPKWTRLPIKLMEFFRALIIFDQFHFISGETLLNRRLRRWEFRCYKWLGKELTMHFVGSDIRDPYRVFDQEERLVRGQLPEKSESLDWQRRLIEDAETYAHHILVSTPDLLDVCPQAVYYPVLIDLEDLGELIPDVEEKKSDEEILIVHAPSNPAIKGSAAIDSVMKNILDETTLPVRYINTAHTDELGPDSQYNLSRQSLFQLYRQAHIVIDQMLIGWYGLQALEALMCNCQVITYIRPDLESHLAKGCPIRSSSLYDLENTMRTAIDQVRAGGYDHRAGRKWVLEEHTIDENHQALLDCWL
ncbi:MAG: hypothetical protein HKN79_12250 [Flavobacteriales bacterium]|nr:hypothetical protein [Flavobacteriales bacterium]